MGVAEQGCDLELLQFQFNRLWEKSWPLPSEEVRRTFVVGESQAGMYAYGSSRAAESGLYALLDIGAGTTDMSIFRYSNQETATQFYSTALYRAGADRVDKLILDQLDAQPMLRTKLTRLPRSEWLGRIRVAKQEDPKTRRAVIPEKVYEQASEQFGRELFQQYRGIWTKGFAKEPRVDRWQNLTIFLIGGGSRLYGLKYILAASPSPGIPRSQVRVLELPSGMSWDGNSTNATEMIERFQYLLTVAYALSFPYVDLGNYAMIDKVEVLLPPEPMDRWRDPDQHGHWW
jgi:hypothetical protein